MRLLKWQFQPQKRSRSWRATINDQRDEIEQLLHDDPSLRREVDALIRMRYRTARANAAGETGLALRAFPSRYPYPAEQVLDSTYFPEATEIRCLSDGEIDLVAGASGIKDGTSNTLMIVSRTERHNAAAHLEAAIAVESECGS